MFSKPVDNAGNGDQLQQLPLLRRSSNIVQSANACRGRMHGQSTHSGYRRRVAACAVGLEGVGRLAFSEVWRVASENRSSLNPGSGVEEAREDALHVINCVLGER